MADSVQDEDGGNKANQPPPVVVKKYANRRLYNTDSSSYITLDTLADMVRSGREFTVHDAKTGEDITRGVLTQIIVEEESKGRAMLPTSFLRQLIGFYGQGVQSLVPRYLEEAMASFARQQEQVRRTVQQTLGPFMPFGIEEVGRQNLAMMERAMSLFSPFHRESEPVVSAPAPGAESPAGPAPAELQALRAEVEKLRAELAAVRASAAERPRLTGSPLGNGPAQDQPVADETAAAAAEQTRSGAAQPANGAAQGPATLAGGTAVADPRAPGAQPTNGSAQERTASAAASAALERGRPSRAQAVNGPAKDQAVAAERVSATQGKGARSDQAKAKLG